MPYVPPFVGALLPHNHIITTTVLNNASKPTINNTTMLHTKLEFSVGVRDPHLIVPHRNGPIWVCHGEVIKAAQLSIDVSN